MKEEYQAICRAAMADPAGRGLAGHTRQLPPLEELAQSLAGAKGVVLISGFPVRTQWGVVGETDGPSGIAWLAGALTGLDIPVRIYTGQNCLDQIEAARQVAAPRAELKLLPHRGGEAFARAQLEEFGPSHLISLERPGRSADGVCYNSKGISIEDLVADAESLFLEAGRRGVYTIGVGDGGNELGMGGARSLVEEYVRHGKKICARQKADATLVAGVSNWWGWGLCGALSLAAGRDLMPSGEDEKRLLEAVLAAGGADGETARADGTVDAMPLSVHLEVLEQIRRAALGKIG